MKLVCVVVQQLKKVNSTWRTANIPVAAFCRNYDEAGWFGVDFVLPRYFVHFVLLFPFSCTVGKSLRSLKSNYVCMYNPKTPKNWTNGLPTSI